jgi:hypothetical protein
MRRNVRDASVLPALTLPSGLLVSQGTDNTVAIYQPATDKPTTPGPTSR